MLQFKPHAKKAAALFLSAALLATSVHFTPPAAAGTEWVQPSVDKLMSWGVITGRDGGAQQLNSRISRAEFTAMVNRAYGYTEPSETPFTDVPAWAWFADDIAIGYNTGYFSGTTETTASPNNTLTREQAITLLARNMRLPESSGEVTRFADGRSFSNWAKGYIKSAVDSGIVNGYGDGTFRPNNLITREQLAAFLYRYASQKGRDVSGRTALNAFADAGQVASYAVEPLSWAVSAGLVNGVSADTLSPRGNASRAQVAVILSRFVQNVR